MSQTTPKKVRGFNTDTARQAAKRGAEKRRAQLNELAQLRTLFRRRDERVIQAIKDGVFPSESAEAAVESTLAGTNPLTEIEIPEYLIKGERMEKVKDAYSARFPKTPDAECSVEELERAEEALEATLRNVRGNLEYIKGLKRNEAEKYAGAIETARQLLPPPSAEVQNTYVEIDVTEWDLTVEFVCRRERVVAPRAERVSVMDSPVVPPTEIRYADTWVWKYNGIRKDLSARKAKERMKQL